MMCKDLISKPITIIAMKSFKPYNASMKFLNEQIKYQDTGVSKNGVDWSITFPVNELQS